MDGCASSSATIACCGHRLALTTARAASARGEGDAGGLRSVGRPMVSAYVPGAAALSFVPWLRPADRHALPGRVGRAKPVCLACAFAGSQLACRQHKQGLGGYGTRSTWSTCSQQGL